MISSTTWSLTEMCKTHLSIEREGFDPDETAIKLDGSVGSPDPMLKFVRHCELDAHLHMAIAAKVQILPLTRQLTLLVILGIVAFYLLQVFLTQLLKQERDPEWRSC